MDTEMNTDFWKKKILSRSIGSRIKKKSKAWDLHGSGSRGRGIRETEPSDKGETCSIEQQTGDFRRESS